MRACEHGDHPCPEGRIFCSIACEACELADCPAGEECAGVCNRSETNMTNTMQFGAALALAKIGHRIAREGWNGKEMFVAYMPGVVIPAEKVNERTRKFVPEGYLQVRRPYFFHNHPHPAALQPCSLPPNAVHSCRPLGKVALPLLLFQSSQVAAWHA